MSETESHASVFTSSLSRVSSFKDSIRSSPRIPRSSGTGNPFKIKSYSYLTSAQAHGQISNWFRYGPLGYGVRLSLHVPVSTVAFWVLHTQFRTLHGWQILGILGEGVSTLGSCCLYWRVAVDWVSFSLLSVYGQKDPHLPLWRLLLCEQLLLPSESPSGFSLPSFTPSLVFRAEKMYPHARDLFLL